MFDLLPGQLDPRIAEAQALADAGQPLAARELVRAALRDDMDNAEAWRLAMRLSRSRPEAIHCLEQVLRLEPSDQASRERLEEFQAEEQSKSGGKHLIRLTISPALKALLSPALALITLLALGAFLLAASGVIEPPEGPFRDGLRSGLSQQAEPGQLYEGEILGIFEAHEYSFRAEAGQPIRIEVDGEACDMRLRLIDPRGHLQAESDDAEGLNPRLAIIPGLSGIHSARIDAFDPPCKYTILIEG